MRIFTNILALLLAAVIGFSPIAQIQNSSSDYTFRTSEGDGTTVIIDISNRIIWGVINHDSGSSIVSVNFYTDTKEDRRNSSKTELALESILERFSSIYLLLTRDIECSQTIRELLYPFHFYF